MLNALYANYHHRYEQLHGSTRPITQQALQRFFCTTILISLLIIAGIETFGFNSAFWNSLSASTDSPSVVTQTGSGLTRIKQGLLVVSDPNEAYFQLDSDSSSAYIRIDPPTRDAITLIQQQHKQHESQVQDHVHLRIDENGYAAKTHLFSTQASQSRYINVGAAKRIRVWVQEAQGTIIPIRAIRANIHVPFAIQWLRVAIMLIIAILVSLWQPHSIWWRVTLNPPSSWQRLSFIAVVSLMGLFTAAGIWVQIHAPAPTLFHAPRSYVYDFNQYQYTTDALLHGRSWLNLPAPKAFTNLANPYNPELREHLLSQGVSPIYWDYAFFHGKWYSYFGVVPVILLLIPYRILSYVFTGTAHSLPTPAAVMIFLFAALICSWLLTIRLMRRINPRISIAATSMGLVSVFLGSQMGYLWLKPDFYALPFAASLMFTTLGLWLWLGSTQLNHTEHNTGTLAAQPQRLRIVHLAGGTACMVANLGCRPIFIVSIMLAFPIFWRHITHIPTMWRTRHYAKLVSYAASILIPTAFIVLPLGFYNTIRFGSAFSFGNDYQITVSDMRGRIEPLANIALIVRYYLALPLRYIRTFPFLATQPTPLPYWSYTEHAVSGLLIICPILLLIALLPLVRRALRTATYHCLPLLIWCALLGLATITLTTAKAGFVWRYTCDAGWLFALSAVGTLSAFMANSGEHTDSTPSNNSNNKSACSTMSTNLLIHTRHIIIDIAIRTAAYLHAIIQAYYKQTLLFLLMAISTLYCVLTLLALCPHSSLSVLVSSWL